MTPRVPAPLCAVVTRARDGAYLSAGQLAGDLRKAEARSAARRRELATTVALIATVIAMAILLFSARLALLAHVLMR